jgi:hypothetical protein
MGPNQKLDESEISELKNIKVKKEYHTRKYYNLFIKKIIYIPNENESDNLKLGDEYFCLGCFYDGIDENYDQAKKYYLKAITFGNSNAMANLGYHYENIEENYDLAKKYYLMAISLGNSEAMLNLCYYYKHIEKNYNLVKKYYLLIANIDIRKFSHHYYDIVIDYASDNVFEHKIINGLCKLFCNKQNNEENKKQKFEIIAGIIFEYLSCENNYENLPKNINLFFLQIGKILFKENKQENKQNNKESYKNIINHHINELTKNNEFSKIILMKHIKDLYDCYIEKK